MLARLSDPPFIIATRQLGIGAKATCKLLGNRVSRSAVKHWRAGRSKPPVWVFEVIDRELAAIESATGAARKAIIGAASLPRNNAALTAWQAHRARQKEKAGS